MGMKKREFWFVTGSQHLYGEDALAEVAAHSARIAEGLDRDPLISGAVLFKPIVTTPEEINRVCLAANSDSACAGVIVWMHTFSPAKMWIHGLSRLTKPLLHLHTQYNRDIPWDRIDMDFMNVNQSAHGDREHGFINTRMGVARKVIAGYWESPDVRGRIARWMRSAAAYAEGAGLKVARFGDNMRQVAVTEGDKVEAQIKFGWTVNGYGVGDLVARMNEFGGAGIERLLEEYEELYDIAPQGRSEGAVREAIRQQAHIELGLTSFLEEGGYSAFTTTFEDLHGLQQLPGLAVQRLMAQGYGFGGEGDWKTAAFVRLMKLMADNQDTSFMEDYTYHFEPGRELVLGAHMLEVCPTIASDKPRLEVHPLGIGGKADPARLVFDGKPGAAINASLIDLGGRFRLVVNEVDCVRPVRDMPHLPVARVLWQPQPSLVEAAEAWIYAGGAHHTALSYAVTADQLMDWAEMAGIECVVIDKHTRMSALRNEMRWSDMYWRLK